MKRPTIAVAIAFLACVATEGQTSSKTFDNFDRSQGVSVYRPPAPPAPEVAAKETRRVRRNGKWVVEVIDPLVKKTGSSTPKTGWKVEVTDGLALRENPVAAGAIRLAMGTNTGLKEFTTGSPLYDSYIVEFSRKYRIDPLLIYAQMHQESSFKVRATSHKGASGLMQLMPATARRFGVTSIYDPKQNIEAGIRYMRWLLDYFGQDVVLALAGYNAGEGAVLRFGRNVPPYRETQEYVRRITARYNSISDPTYIQSARPLGPQLAKAEQKESRPLTIYEPSPMAVRLPDGKMMLFNQ
jgi:soluble lytic murein transglycosylase-like protein